MDHHRKRPLGNLGVDGGNIKINLQEVGWGIEWFDVSRDRDR
jgi:hypothetical protein